jgi:hypothetical protein
VVVHGRTGVNGVIGDRCEAGARTEQEQSRDPSDFRKSMERLVLTGENVEGG